MHHYLSKEQNVWSVLRKVYKGYIFTCLENTLVFLSTVTLCTAHTLNTPPFQGQARK